MCRDDSGTPTGHATAVRITTITAVRIRYGGLHDQVNAKAPPTTKLYVTAVRPTAPLTAAKAAAKCSP